MSLLVLFFDFLNTSWFINHQIGIIVLFNICKLVSNHFSCVPEFMHWINISTIRSCYKTGCDFYLSVI